MSITKEQFQTLVRRVTEKLRSDVVEFYIDNNCCAFWIARETKELMYYYHGFRQSSVRLDKLADNGMMAEQDYSSFLNQLLADLKEVSELANQKEFEYYNTLIDRL